MKKSFNTNNTITAETLQHLANAITIKALKTNYSKSGNNAMRDMLNDAIRFAHNPETAHGGDGAQLVQETALYLWQYQGRNLDDLADDGQTDKDGNPITILRGAFRYLGKIIHGHKQRIYKQLYIADYENEHGEIAIPFMWDIDSQADYMTTTEIITALELTENQKYILGKRLQGYSLQEIGDIKNISKQAVSNTLSKIGNKYIKTFGVISVPIVEKISK